ncbi:diaminobutyrate acetyltransferase [Nocardia tenerifensis]|uniref:L-2,4-diaminobutyric acid acetyltransferase n=1 Tax=Nocardia tenerifensis TaxID=228006 RepID=A0A318JUS4_9NOCA|nr:diaminobutyrate acetyltransferase [Nocardia tenerifensis]PXX57438.1 diaminobutyrate acetyltransferase [Nocardia tenerifensis]
MSLPTVNTAEIERSRVEQAVAALGTTTGRKETGPAVVLRAPRVGDGAQLWRIAKDSAVLDTNSSYAYVLWCRDFAATSVVAEVRGRVVGFVIGYIRPQAPDTVFVWQIAVDRVQQGKGTGAQLLHALLDNVGAQGVSKLETTISPDNAASIALFGSVARRRAARITKHPLFDAGVFPDSHAPEDLYLIAPTARTTQEDHR